MSFMNDPFLRSRFFLNSQFLKLRFICNSYCETMGWVWKNFSVLFFFSYAIWIHYFVIILGYTVILGLFYLDRNFITHVIFQQFLIRYIFFIVLFFLIFFSYAIWIVLALEAISLGIWWGHLWCQNADHRNSDLLFNTYHSCIYSWKVSKKNPTKVE